MDRRDGKVGLKRKGTVEIDKYERSWTPMNRAEDVVRVRVLLCGLGSWRCSWSCGLGVVVVVLWRLGCFWSWGRGRFGGDVGVVAHFDGLWNVL